MSCDMKILTGMSIMIVYFAFGGYTYTKPDNEKVMLAIGFWESSKSVLDTMNATNLSSLALKTFLEMEKDRVPESVYDNLHDIGFLSDTSSSYYNYLGRFYDSNKVLAAKAIKGGIKTIAVLSAINPEDKSRFVLNNLKIDIKRIVTIDEARQIDSGRLIVGVLLYRAINGADGFLPIERTLLRSYLLKKCDK
jgi:hypothetical protein